MVRWIMIKLGESILRGAMDALDYAQGKQHGSKPMKCWSLQKSMYQLSERKCI
jgi:hypothetical protein